MLKLGAIYCCLILILAGQAKGQSSLPLSGRKADSKLSTSWRMKLTGSDYHDERSQFKIVGIAMDLNSRYSLTKSLYLDFQPSIKMQTGQSQTFDSADRPENKLAIQEAALHYKPFDSLKISGGALNQSYMHTGLLIDPIAFPASRISTAFGTSHFNATLAFESAIPTSTSLSSNTKELEATPSLNSVMTKILINPEGRLKGSFKLGYFAFANTPSSVAQKSSLFGNSVTKVSDADYRLNHEFQGIESGIEMEIPVSLFMTAVLGGEYLLNEKGPNENNVGYLYFGKGILNLKRDMDLSLGGGYFSLASDSTISYFNASNFETNRVGYFAETSLAFKREGFSLGVRYSDSEVLFSNSFQSREKLILLKMETSYANL